MSNLPPSTTTSSSGNLVPPKSSMLQQYLQNPALIGTTPLPVAVIPATSTGSLPATGDGSSKVAPANTDGNQAPENQLTQELYDAEVARLEHQSSNAPMMEGSIAAADELMALHSRAKVSGLRVNIKSWDIIQKSAEIYTERIEIAQLENACPKPPDALIASMVKFGAAESTVHAWRLWHAFCQRRHSVVGIPDQLSASDYPAIIAIADSTKVGSWDDAHKAIVAEQDRIDMFLGHPFTKDGQRENAWYQWTENDSNLVDALNDLAREVAPARTTGGWDRLSYNPLGCTDEFLDDIAFGLITCARALIGDAGDQDAHSDHVDYRYAAALCLLAGLGPRVVMIVGFSPGLHDYWPSIASCAKIALDPSHPDCLRKRKEYVEAVKEAHKVSGVPLGFLRLDWSDVARLILDLQLATLNLYPQMERALKALAILHLLKYLRIKGRPLQGQQLSLVVRYQGLTATIQSDQPAPGPLDVICTPKGTAMRSLRQLLKMELPAKADQTVADRAATWALKNMPSNALAELCSIGDNPSLLVDPNGITATTMPQYGSSWLRAHHGFDGVAAFVNGRVQPIADLRQADLIRYHWSTATAQMADHARWKATLPSGYIDAAPFSASLIAAFPNMLLPTDPVVKETYLILLVALLTVNMYRDRLRRSRWGEALAREFPYLCILPRTGKQGSGGSGRKGGEFNIGKSALSQLIIETTRGCRWDSGMSTSGIDGGDVANRSTTESVRNNGFFTADEFPFEQLSVSDDTGANGPFSADGLCRWATGDTNLCPVVRENAPQLPLRYLSILSGKPYPRMRDDMVSRMVFVFLGPLVKNPEIQGQLLTGTLARNTRLAHLAWLAERGWSPEFEVGLRTFDNWRFPVHAMVMESLYEGSTDNLDKVSEWMRSERARIGDEARSDANTKGPGGVLEHLVDSARSDAFEALFGRAKTAKDPREPQRYVGSWEFFGILAAASKGIGADEDNELRHLIGKNATAKLTTAAAKRLFDREVAIVFYDRWAIRYVDDKDASNPIKNGAGVAMAAIEIRDLLPHLPRTSRDLARRVEEVCEKPQPGIES